LYLTNPSNFVAETLKKQAKQQASEYDRLAEQYNKETGKTSDKRRD
jgi:B-cell receptor-associated protein 31